MLKRIKKIRSHAGLSRFLSEVPENPIAYLARVQVEEIPSPYAYSPTKAIYDWDNRDIIWFETSHKCYEIFEVPPTMLRFKTDEEAADWHCRFAKKPA